MASGRILTVKILTDASGAQKGLGAAQLEYGKFAQALGAKSPSFGTEVGDKLVGGIDKALGVGLKVVGGAGAAVLGTALFKGFNRLTDIDQATAKLEGLGHSAGTVQKIMDNALKSVQGTAFGLGDAAGVAANLVAAGIAPGQRLEKTLKGVADAATIGGTSMDDMGSIFSKVAASNRLNADVINQMTDRGIPVLQLLADHYGVTAREASRMVSSGQVDFQNFADAMESGMGGAALKSGETFTGAWQNVMASLGRIGANLLGPLFEGTKNGLQGLPALMAPIEEKAKAVGQAFGDMLKWVQQNIGLLTTLGKIAGAVVGALLLFRTVVAVMQAYNVVMGVVRAAMVGYQAAQAGLTLGTAALTGATTAQRAAALAGAIAQWAMNSAMLASPITWIIVGIVALVAAIVLIATKTRWFQQLWEAVWGAVQSAAAAVWSWMQSAFSAVGAAWAAVVNAFSAAFNAVIGAIRGAWLAVWSWASSYVSGQINTAIAVVRAVQAAIAAVVSFIQSAWGAVWSWASGIAQSALAAVLKPVNAIRDAFSAVVDAIRNAVSWIGKLKFPSPPGWLSGILGMSAAVPAAGYGISPAAFSFQPAAAFAALPSLRAPAFGAGGGDVIYNITVEGGLDSADTISRRLQDMLDARERRSGGVTLARRGRG